MNTTEVRLCLFCGGKDRDPSITDAIKRKIRSFEFGVAPPGYVEMEEVPETEAYIKPVTKSIKNAPEALDNIVIKYNCVPDVETTTNALWEVLNAQRKTFVCSGRPADRGGHGRTTLL